MSYFYEETYAVYNEYLCKARKDHPCSACEETIALGHLYFRVASLYDGHWTKYRRCLRCQTIHLHLRGKGDCELWPHETLNCGEDYKQHWGEDPPESIAALAFLSQDDMQKPENQETLRMLRKQQPG